MKSPNNPRQQTPRFRSVCISRQWRGAAAAGRWAFMRIRVLALLLLISGGLLGCSCSGDFGGFLVQQVTSLGGRAVTNVALPKLEANWTFKRDKNGFEATAGDTSFSSVDAFMRQAFGTPKICGFNPEIGQSNSVWAASDIGVAIILGGQTNGVRLACVRGMRGTEEMLSEMEKPWWKKLW